MLDCHIPDRGDSNEVTDSTIVECIVDDERER